MCSRAAYIRDHFGFDVFHCVWSAAILGIGECHLSSRAAHNITVDIIHFPAADSGFGVRTSLVTLVTQTWHFPEESPHGDQGAVMMSIAIVLPMGMLPIAGTSSEGIKFARCPSDGIE
jgi:hypothetical protein